MPNKEKVLVIVGQTAVGKTSMSLKLASSLNGEIINGDAMQVYKNLNIVTDKIKKEKMGNIPHHLFDIKDINEDYSVEEYQGNIRKVISEVTSSNFIVERKIKSTEKEPLGISFKKFQIPYSLLG